MSEIDRVWPYVRASGNVSVRVRVWARMCTFCVSAFVYDFVFVYVYARSSAFIPYFVLLNSYFLLTSVFVC